MGATDTAWRCGPRSIRRFFAVPPQKVGTDGQCCLSHALSILTWLLGLPVTCVPGQHIHPLLSLPFWAVCFLLVPRGSPKGVFRVSWQGVRHRGYSWPHKGGRWRAWKKKKIPHTNTHRPFITQSLLELNWSILLSVLDTKWWFVTKPHFNEELGSS